MNFEIPAGLTDLLHNFTVAVLREKPTDLVQFASDYFNNINEKRNTVSSEATKEDESSEETESDSGGEILDVPPVVLRRRIAVDGGSWQPDPDNTTLVVHPKSDEQKRRLTEASKHIFLFRRLKEDRMAKIIDAMYEKLVEPDEHVIKQGDDGDNFYVIDSGVYDVFIEKDGANNKVGSYDNKGSFGELALMYSQPRAASIVATTQGSLWVMDRGTFRTIMVTAAAERRNTYEALLDNVPLLKSLNSYERTKVADALYSKTYEDGQRIIKQGDTASCMYFLDEGEVVVKMSQADATEEVEINRSTKGCYFGVLDVDAFERLLGPCLDIMKRNITDYEQQIVSIFGSTAKVRDLR